LDYGYKPTTTGRAILAACLANQTPLILTRVAMGSGVVPEGTNLADMHELVSYVADGSLGERTHKDDRLYFSVQYENNAHPDVGTFYLSEFIVYAVNPDTGEEGDLLYATLGDYKQPVPAYSPSLPPSVWKFPLVLVVADEVTVSVTAAPGLVTHEDLQRAIARIGGIEKAIELTMTVDGWREDAQAANGYRYYYDLQDTEINSDYIPAVIVAEDSMETAVMAGIGTTVTSYEGFIRIKAMAHPESTIHAICYLQLKNNTNTIGTTTIAGEYEIADNTEVQGAIEEIFGEKTETAVPGGGVPVGSSVATEQEVQKVIDGIFGTKP